MPVHQGCCAWQPSCTPCRPRWALMIRWRAWRLSTSRTGERPQAPVRVHTGQLRCIRLGHPVRSLILASSSISRAYCVRSSRTTLDRRQTNPPMGFGTCLAFRAMQIWPYVSPWRRIRTMCSASSREQHGGRPRLRPRGAGASTVTDASLTRRDPGLAAAVRGAAGAGIAVVQGSLRRALPLGRRPRTRRRP
jgi:hypothetical protein